FTAILGRPVEIAVCAHDQVRYGIRPVRSGEVIQDGLGPVCVQLKHSSALPLARAPLVAAAISGGAVQVPGGVHEQTGGGLRSIRGVPSKAVKHGKSLRLGQWAASE